MFALGNANVLLDACRVFDRQTQSMFPKSAHHGSQVVGVRYLNLDSEPPGTPAGLCG